MTVSPYALTDSHVAALEKAIRAEGYDIQYDTDTGEFTLTRPARDWPSAASQECVSHTMAALRSE